VDELAKRLDPDNVAAALADPVLVNQLREDVAAAHRALTAARRQLDSQLQLAASIHQSLLPKPVRRPQIDIDFRYWPIDAVGGNYCQVRFPDSESCYVTMCDVSGHGIAPSLIATRVSSEVRHFILDGLRPLEIVRSLNEFIYEHFADMEIFLTFMAARIDLRNRTLTYSGAGHPAALHLRAPGILKAIVSQNIPIGVQADCLSDEPEDTRKLEAGDRLLFCTSVLHKSTDSDGKTLGERRFAQFAANALSTDTFFMADRILADVAEFRCGPPTDDMTLIIAELK